MAALADRVRSSRHGVLYLDGGWQSIVDGLLRVGREAGLEVHAGAPVTHLELDAAALGVHLADGRFQAARSVLIAADPATAARLTGERVASLQRAAAAAQPVLAATLDVGLRRLPAPRATFALGIERPLYFSVHSAAARLAPEGAALIHLAVYRGADPGGDPQRFEAELLGLLDAVQPGWRAEVVEQRFAPHLKVAQDRATAARGGLRGRPDVAVPEVEGLFVAGDWVGPEGLIADAAAASAERAARMILARAEARRAA
jgi:phytoene dehydrogenase-like protein